MKKNKNKRTHVFYLFTIITILVAFLGIGYAQMSGVTLNVDGTAKLDEQTGIVITNVTYQGSNNTDPSLSSINTYYQSLLDSTIVLGNDPTSSITYQVSIKNITDEEYTFDQIVYDSSFYDNPNITYELNSLTQGDTIQPNETINFTLTFKYLSTDISNNTLNSYINIKFNPVNTVLVTFDVDGGTPQPQELHLGPGTAIGTLPTPTKEICANTTGSTPEERGCTFIGEFQGWFLEPEFTTQVDQNYVVNEDITLYAKWHSTYEQQIIESMDFDGVDDCLDMNINVYSEDNKDQDFDINFDIVSFEKTNNTQPTIMNVKDEENSLFPGLVIRFNTGSITTINLNSRWNTTRKNLSIQSSSAPVHVEVIRRDGVVQASLTGTGTDNVALTTLYNQSSWQLNRPFPHPITLGCIYNSEGNKDRFFKGRLENIDVKVH